jgi:hypothetical protein
MAAVIRILSPFPSGVKTILLEAKGVNHTYVNGERFMKMAYADAYKQGMVAGYVEIYDEASEFEGGVYQTTGATETTDGGNTLVRIKKVEWARNRFT